MKYHTFFGVKELSRMKALRESADPMFVALQHHVHFNNNGYPQRPGGWDLRLFSRICTVADYYDAMTASRTYQKVPVTPDKALRFILENSGQIFDPGIAKVFIQAMGLYPVGTVVEMDTGEVGVVVRQNTQLRHIHRPVVQLVDPDAPEYSGDTIDLSDTTPDGAYPRSVTRSIPDSQIGLDRRSLFVELDEPSL
jgi:HD-GYP domain-containing protein (c-di-GMP phosphodiesterase class II)